MRELNDELRLTLTGGTLVLTSGLVHLGAERQQTALRAIANFDGFDAENDPYDEHDFGEITVEGERLFFKIDYFDPDRQGHSADPADPSLTRRVLTVMLADEY